MKKILWSPEKNAYLQETRGISFEEIRDAIIKNEDFDGREHHVAKYSHQRMFVLKIHDYTFVVPYVLTPDGNIFLKTAYPCRKFHY